MNKKTVFLISGKLHSGKNTFANFIKNHLKNTPIKVSEDSFASDLKNNIAIDFSQLMIYLNNLSNMFITEINNLSTNYQHINFNSLRNLVNKLHLSNENFYDDKTDISRILLQIYGTEIFRNRVCKDYWTDIVLKRLLTSDSNLITITDVRFPSEIDFLKNVDKNFNLITIRINRNIDRKELYNTHISETALDDYTDWSEYIDVNGNKIELEKKALEILNKYVL